ncbi:MAG: UDP-glucose/GDP-mannose dehydrogenase family protein [Sedimentisphaerales bacterium]|nr:UDP-glucose/GDP-mannose dehydrogenase family protein [Sedimentisphaerales bacterium]
MKICTIGAGYVGLVSGACFAEAGNEVICVDKDEGRIARLCEGIVPIYEPELDRLVERNLRSGRLRFTTDMKEAVRRSLIIILAVGTPAAADGSSDMSFVDAVVTQIGELIEEYRIIVMKSTVPVGTHARIAAALRSRTDVPFDYVANPEFLKEGGAVEDFMRPNRVIIGTASPRAREVMAELYSPFMRKSNRILYMDPMSAEMTKYAANAMLATRISFMNEIAMLCEQMGADVELVRRGLGSDPRIGSAFLFPGVGFGGSCFPKDIRSLVHIGQSHGLPMDVVRAVWHVNQAARERFTDRVRAYFSGRENRVTLAVWGLAFKASTDDVRESPALYCVRRFLDWGMKVKAYDPEAGQAASAALDGRIQLCTNAYESLDGSDALVVLTDWQEFRTPDFEAIRSRLRRPVVFDGRNLYDPARAEQAGLEYHCVGRASRPGQAATCRNPHDQA